MASLHIQETWGNLTIVRHIWMQCLIWLSWLKSSLYLMTEQVSMCRKTKRKQNMSPSQVSKASCLSQSVFELGISTLMTQPLFVPSTCQAQELVDTDAPIFWICPVVKRNQRILSDYSFCDPIWDMCREEPTAWILSLMQREKTEQYNSVLPLTDKKYRPFPGWITKVKKNQQTTSYIIFLTVPSYFDLSD